MPVDTWGSGKSKTLAHLLSEVNSGQIWFEKLGDQLVRVGSGVSIDVLYTTPSQRLILVEALQVFANGWTRVRDHPESVIEKAELGELPEDTAKRAMRQELGLVGVSLTCVGGHSYKEFSPSYPGLLTENNKSVFECQLTPSQYRPEGYVERQEDKTTYFIWQYVK